MKIERGQVYRAPSGNSYIVEGVEENVEENKVFIFFPFFKIHGERGSLPITRVESAQFLGKLKDPNKINLIELIELTGGN